MEEGGWIKREQSIHATEQKSPQYYCGQRQRPKMAALYTFYSPQETVLVHAKTERPRRVFLTKLKKIELSLKNIYIYLVVNNNLTHTHTVNNENR